MKSIIRYMACAGFYPAALVLMMAPVAVCAVGDVAAGKWKAQTCLGCHGVPTYTNVYPTYHVPRLGGQHADYIVAALQAYRNGERDHQTMVAQSHRLDQQDMADVAAYFASFESAEPNPQAQVPAGLQEQVAVCSACHNNDGNSSITLYPKIAGQRENYLYQSLVDYKTGRRKNPIMMGIVATLDEESMETLSRYFSGHPGLGSIEISITSK